MINQKKEYDENGQLTFEARYENGKINGKEYEKDELIFEGEYKYNQELDMLEAINFTIKSIFGTLTLKLTLIRWTGKGKEYNREGNLIYEGELFQGKKNGKGKEYNEKGQLIYEGEFLNGEKHGKGKIYNIEENLEIESEFFNGKEIGISKTYKHGILIKEINYSKPYTEGKEYNEQGKLIFEGTFKAGYHDTGNYKEYYEDGNLKLEGKLEDGYLKGIVKEYYDDKKLLF